MALEPNKEDFAELERACNEKGVRPTAIGTDVLDAFKRDEFTLSNIGEWLGKQKEKRAHLFWTPVADDLEHRAFADNNITARGALWKQLGAKEYAEREAAWKANGNKHGEKPKDDGKPKSPNPWRPEHWNISAQGRVIRQLGLAKAAELAKAAGVSIGSTRPAKVA